jgi:hypothetical protein
LCSPAAANGGLYRKACQRWFTDARSTISAMARIPIAFRPATHESLWKLCNPIAGSTGAGDLKPLPAIVSNVGG